MFKLTSDLFKGLSGRFCAVFYATKQGEIKKYIGKVEPNPAKDLEDASKYVTLKLTHSTIGGPIYRAFLLTQIRMVKANKKFYFTDYNGRVESEV